MARFRNTFTGVTVSVDDEKSDRFTADGWERVEDGEKKSPVKPRAKKSE